MNKHYNIIVKGKVQGVFYRASTIEKANELKLKGMVKNLPNGDVAIEVEGEEEIIQKLIDWCKIGPPRAKVDKVEVVEGELKGYESFKMER